MRFRYVVLSSLTLVPFAAHLVWTGVAGHRYRTRLAEIEERKLLVQPDEMDAKRSAAAFAVHVTLHGALEKLRDEETEELREALRNAMDHSAWSDDTRAELEGVIASAAPLLADLETVLASEACGEVLSANVPTSGRRPRLMSCRDAVHLLTGRALLEAGDPAKADLAALHFAQALDFARVVEDGSLIGFMVAEALHSMVLHSVHTALESEGLDPRPLQAALEPRLAALSDVGRLDRALRGDGAEFLRLIETGTEAEVMGSSASSLRDWWWRPFFYSTMTDWADAYEEALGVARRPPHEIFALARDPDWDEGDDVLFAPKYLTSVGTAQIGHARLELARAALVLELHRLEHGEWPERLADVDLELPRDPHTRRAFHYHKRDSGMQLGPAAWYERAELTNEAVRNCMLVWHRSP